MDTTALLVSLKLAGATVGVLAAIAIPLGGWLASTRSRASWLVEAFVTVPLVLPPTVVGFYLLLATAPDSFIGRAAATVGLGRLPFTFGGILAGSVIVNLPLAVRPIAAAFAGVDRALVESSWCLGVSRRATFHRVVIPLALPGIIAGLTLTFAHALGEFGVVLMLGGNIPGVTRTLSVALFDNVQSLDMVSAHAAAGVLLVVAVATSLGVRLLTRKRRRA